MSPLIHSDAEDVYKVLGVPRLNSHQHQDDSKCLHQQSQKRNKNLSKRPDKTLRSRKKEPQTSDTVVQISKILFPNDQNAPTIDTRKYSRKSKNKSGDGDDGGGDTDNNVNANLKKDNGNSQLEKSLPMDPKLPRADKPRHDVYVDLIRSLYVKLPKQDAKSKNAVTYKQQDTKYKFEAGRRKEQESDKDAETILRPTIASASKTSNKRLLREIVEREETEHPGSVYASIMKEKEKEQEEMVNSPSGTKQLTIARSKSKAKIPSTTTKAYDGEVPLQLTMDKRTQTSGNTSTSASILAQPELLRVYDILRKEKVQRNDKDIRDLVQFLKQLKAFDSIPADFIASVSYVAYLEEVTMAGTRIFDDVMDLESGWFVILEGCAQRVHSHPIRMKKKSTTDGSSSNNDSTVRNAISTDRQTNNENVEHTVIGNSTNVISELGYGESFGACSLNNEHRDRKVGTEKITTKSNNVRLLRVANDELSRIAKLIQRFERTENLLFMKSLKFLTSQLKDGQLEVLSKMLKTLRIPKGTPILYQSQPVRYFAMVREGKVAVQRHIELSDSKTVTHHRKMLERGDYFGEGGLWNDLKTRRTVTAILSRPPSPGVKEWCPKGVVTALTKMAQSFTHSGLGGSANDDANDLVSFDENISIDYNFLSPFTYVCESDVVLLVVNVAEAKMKEFGNMAPKTKLTYCDDAAAKIAWENEQDAKKWSKYKSVELKRIVKERMGQTGRKH